MPQGSHRQRLAPRAEEPRARRRLPPLSRTRELLFRGLPRIPLRTSCAAHKEQKRFSESCLFFWIAAVLLSLMGEDYEPRARKHSQSEPRFGVDTSPRFVQHSSSQQSPASIRRDLRTCIAPYTTTATNPFGAGNSCHAEETKDLRNLWTRCDARSIGGLSQRLTPISLSTAGHRFVPDRSSPMQLVLVRRARRQCKHPALFLTLTMRGQCPAWRSLASCGYVFGSVVIHFWNSHKSESSRGVCVYQHELQCLPDGRGPLSRDPLP
jgi:hypothetical protein